MVSDDRTGALLAGPIKALAELAHSHTLGHKALLHSPEHMTTLTKRMPEVGSPLPLLTCLPTW